LDTKRFRVWTRSALLLPLDKSGHLGVCFRVSKRILLWSGLFSAGLLAGLAIAWGFGIMRRGGDGPTGRHRLRDAMTITLSATIDGSDRFVFTPDNVWNEHGRWQPPQAVLFNNTPWEDLGQEPKGWQELAKDLNLRGASITTRQGRDLIVLETTAQGFDVCFGDTPMGAGRYTVTISIPRK
jgi:hypothetical protein